MPLPISGDTYEIATEFGVRYVAPANLDGDITLDWVVLSECSENPTGHVALEARATSGAQLWTFDTGLHDAFCGDMVEHLAFIAWDVRPATPWDEVIAMSWVDGDIHIRMLDGRSGAIVAETLFPTASNTDTRQHAAIAFWAGKPHVIITQGVYSHGRVVAYDGDLTPLWTYDHDGYAGADELGTSAHEVVAYDLDRDGNDEVLFGGTCLNSSGERRWSLSFSHGYGHVDVVTPGDILPGNGTHEVFYLVEQGGAALLVDANGRELWQHADPAGHAHAGVAYNIDPASPGDECVVVSKCHEWGYDPGCDGLFAVYAADGTLLGTPQSPTGRFPRWPEWTGDEVYDEDNAGPFIPSFSYGADLGGGSNHGAEEIVFVKSGRKIRVVFNLLADPRPSRWQSPPYRQDVARVLSGYPHFTAVFKE